MMLGRSCSTPLGRSPTSARFHSRRSTASPRWRWSTGMPAGLWAGTPISPLPGTEARLMRILISGGAGCLGSNLTEHWYPRGHDILIVDNFATGRRELVPPIPRLQLVEGSIADRDLVRRAFERFRPTHVVH